jgi:hypothetical protein
VVALGHALLSSLLLFIADITAVSCVIAGAYKPIVAGIPAFADVPLISEVNRPKVRKSDIRKFTSPIKKVR